MVVALPEESVFVELSDSDSAAAVRILALHDLGTEARGVLEVRPAGDELQVVLRHLESSESIVSWDVLYANTDIGLIQYVVREPVIYFAALEAGTVPIFPITVKDGKLLVEGHTSYDQLSQFTEALDAIEASYEMFSIRQSPAVDDLLTERQQQFVVEAVERGYYDTPRQCTLTGLAEASDITKGAASGLLHRAEEHIVKEFVTSLIGKSIDQ